jgi:hypothetical protein
LSFVHNRSAKLIK